MATIRGTDGANSINDKKSFLGVPYDPDTNDLIWGYAGNDTITTYNGNDTVYGGLGNDLISDRGNGNDVFFGDDGFDVLVAGTGQENLYDGGTGTDMLKFDVAGSHWALVDLSTHVANTYSSAGTMVSHATVRNFETVVGTNGTDWLRGNDLANTLIGGAGADRLFGLGGSDRLWGGDGTDLISAGDGDDVLWGGFGGDNLYGEAGSDELAGDDGNDWLLGGLGADKLTGGAGSDRFVFAAVSDSSAVGRDIISGGFERGFDKIDVQRVDAVGSLQFDQAFAFVGSSAFSAEGQVRVTYSSATGITTVLFNTDSDNDSEMMIDIKGFVALDASDFVL